MLGDSIFVHSNTYLGDLLSDANEENAMYNPKDSIDTGDETSITNQSEADFSQSGSQKNLPAKYDIFKVERSGGEQMNSSESSNSQLNGDYEMQDEENSVQNYTYTDSAMRGHLPTSANEDRSMDINQLKENYKELSKEYEDYQNMMLNDSLNEQSFAGINAENTKFKPNSHYDDGDSADLEPVNRKIHHDFGFSPSQSPAQPVQQVNNDREKSPAINDPTRKVSNPIPKFKYKDPAPKFLQRNKITVTTGAKSSYCQKYLAEKDNSRDKKKCRVKNDDGHSKELNEKRTHIQKNSELITHGYDDQNLSNFGYGDTSLENSYTGSFLPTNNLNSIQGHMEISRLDAMIREEENNLKNSVLTVPEPPLFYDQQYPTVLQNSGYDDSHLNIYMVGDTSVLHEPFNYEATTSSRRDENFKRQSYAEIHSVTNDKPHTDEASSYSAQHLEKKTSNNYKKYGIKEYRALTKDVRLQKSLGPDLQSSAYLERKAKAEKQRDYANAVARQNQTLVTTKKVRTAPPSTKDRERESRRLAALEYAKSIKTFSKQSSKPSLRPRPATDDRKESAIEIMKQRHETEKKAIDEMRKSLAGIINKVKI